jgi:hypothetical protein
LLAAIHGGSIERDRATAELQGILRGDSAGARLALAQGAHLLLAEHAWVVEELSECTDSGVTTALARALSSVPAVAQVPVLIGLLADRDARRDARQALVAIGEPALDALEKALSNESLERAVRRHLPRTISRFSGRRPAAILERRLARETDDAIVFKILRGLGRLRADDPSTPVNRALIRRLAKRSVKRAIDMLYFRQLAELARRALPVVRTPASELLVAALADQTERTLERAFRLLHILEPGEELEIVYDAMKSDDAEMRARGRELFEHVAQGAVRTGILALVDDAPPLERLAAALAFHEPSGARTLIELGRELDADEDDRAWLTFGYAALLSTLLADSSRVLSAIAGYHRLELQLDSDADARELGPGRRRGRKGMGIHAHG